MSRPSKFSAAQILDAAATLVAADGPGAATIGAISARLKAPSGSIYHRFASRDVLLGRLWLSKAAFFQNRFTEALLPRDAAKAGLEAAPLPAEIRACRLRWRTDHVAPSARRLPAESGPPDMAGRPARLRQQSTRRWSNMIRAPAKSARTDLGRESAASSPALAASA